MPVEKEIIGSGITARTQVRIVAPFEEEEIGALFGRVGRLTFSSVLASAETVAAEILTAAGLPPRFGLYWRADAGPWTELQKGAPMEAWRSGHAIDCQKGVWSIAKKGGHEPDSAVGYAAQVADRIGWIRHHLSKGATEKACLESLQLGGLVQEAQMKQRWEPAALTGQKVRHETPGANKGGRKRGETISRDMRLAKEFQRKRLSSPLSDTALKQAIGKKDELGRSASVEAVNRGLKKLSG